MTNDYVMIDWCFFTFFYHEGLLNADKDPFHNSHKNAQVNVFKELQYKKETFKERFKPCLITYSEILGDLSIF